MNCMKLPELYSTYDQKSIRIRAVDKKYSLKLSFSEYLNVGGEYRSISADLLKGNLKEICAVEDSVVAYCRIYEIGVFVE